jgi:hypothetical protein
MSFQKVILSFRAEVPKDEINPVEVEFSWIDYSTPIKTDIDNRVIIEQVLISSSRPDPGLPGGDRSLVVFFSNDGGVTKHRVLGEFIDAPDVFAVRPILGILGFRNLQSENDDSRLFMQAGADVRVVMVGCAEMSRADKA